MKKIKIMQTLKKQKGFSIIETALFTVVGAGVLTGVLVTGDKAYQSYKTQETLSYVSLVQDSIDSYYSVFQKTNNLASEMHLVLASVGAVAPARDEAGGATPSTNLNEYLTSPMGRVKVESASVLRNNDSWKLTFVEMPKSGCVSFISKLDMQRYESIKINNQLLPMDATGIFNEQDLVGQCNFGASLPTVEVLAKPFAGQGAGTASTLKTDYVSDLAVELKAGVDVTEANEVQKPLNYTPSGTTMLAVSGAGQVYSSTWADPCYGWLDGSPSNYINAGSVIDIKGCSGGNYNGMEYQSASYGGDFFDVLVGVGVGLILTANGYFMPLMPLSAWDQLLGGDGIEYSNGGQQLSGFN